TVLTIPWRTIARRSYATGAKSGRVRAIPNDSYDCTTNRPSESGTCRRRSDFSRRELAPAAVAWTPRGPRRVGWFGVDWARRLSTAPPCDAQTAPKPARVDKHLS